MNPEEARAMLLALPGDTKEEGEPVTIYLVVFSNYSPWEVDSIWSTYDAAQQHADSLAGDWRVGEMLLDDPGERER